MPKEGKDDIIKKFDRLTIWLFAIALLFLSYGLYHYLYLGTVIVSHPKAPKSSVSNGSLTIFFGIIFIVLALYRTIRRSKLLKQLYDLKRSKN